MVHENMGQPLLKKMKFSIEDFFSKCDQIPFFGSTFTEEILNGKLHFCAVNLITSTALLPEEILCIEYIIKKIFIHFLGTELETSYKVN